MSLLSDYQKFWASNRPKFVKEEIVIKKGTKVYLCERDHIFVHGYRSSKGVPSPCISKSIPYIEISNKQVKGAPILFVGMNPSGADVCYYSTNNTSGDEVFTYCGSSPYYQAMQDFANECITAGVCKCHGYLDASGNVKYSEIDIFGIVQGTQKVIVKHFLDNPELYVKMFELFLRTIVELNPKLIIVANAFVRRLLMRGNDSKDVLINKKYDNFYFNGSIRRYILERDNLYGGYKLVIGDKEFYLYFSCMLSGQRAIDLGNRENLIWLVRNYLIKKHGMKL